MHVDSAPADLDNPLSPEFWARPPRQRHAVFARLRATGRPVFLPPPGSARERLSSGFYALTRYDHVVSAARDVAAFSSAPTALSLLDQDQDALRGDAALSNLDDPRHGQLKKRIIRAFTPRALNRFEQTMAKIARRCVDDVLAAENRDFVAQVATPLPARIICQALGIPGYAVAGAVKASDQVLLSQELGDTTPLPEFAESIAWLHRMISELAARRRRQPADDVISALVAADADGDGLSDRELGVFCMTLITGGHATLRSALPTALMLFTEHPEQRSRLLADLDGLLPGAVEEVLRCASPSPWTRRNVVRETEIGNTVLVPGDRAVLFFESANNDETAFGHPSHFDITRNPNPHLAFGVPGTHYCLGAYLGRLELKVMLRELFTRAPGIRSTGPPTYRGAGIINVLTDLPFSV